MEPGHEDREYDGLPAGPRLQGLASMEPGHEDREYTRFRSPVTRTRSRLNGARS